MHTPSNTVILCASARLTQGLRAWFQSQQVAQGLQQWQAPTITTLTEWLEQTLEHALLLGEVDVQGAPIAMLNSTQEALLWEQAIQHCLQQHEAAALFNTSGLASAAMEANRYIIEWDLSIDVEHATEETRQFLTWRQQFQRLCKQTGHLEAVRFQRWQLNQLALATLPLPSHIELAGFDRINPHLQQLIHMLTAKGVQVTQRQFNAPASQTHQMACVEQNDECRAAVAWAQQTLRAQPNAQLAIVVPELDRLRATLQHLLDDTFHPQSLHPAYAEQPRMYEFSLGLALSDYPVVRTALTLLRMTFNQGLQAQTEMSALLQDVYWSNSLSEADARASLDARMRSTLPLQLRTTAFVAFVTRMQTDKHAIACPMLLTHLQAMMHAVQQAPKTQAPSAWASLFLQVLNAGAWPGERSVSSVEHQTKQRFERTLDEMASLDTWLARITASEALQRLNQLCLAQIFQAQTTVTPNITVMGMLESAAHPLDGVWVMGMNDHVWPPLARTNALIPAELQRLAGTPNASSEVQTAFAQSIHQRLLHSAKQVIFSYAQKEGDRLLRPSPMLQGITASTQASSQCNTLCLTLAEQLAYSSSQDWAWIDDHQAPPVLEGEHVAGGTGLLRAQAICPAWAFYQYRLRARKLDEPQLGLDAMTRGNLIHAVLAQFWQGADSQILTQSNSALFERLESIAKTVMDDFNQAHQGHYSNVFLALEAERLSKLALAWLLEVEQARPVAFKVEACEREITTQIEGIQIKLVIDRIDQLEDGRLVVIDYKTSSVLDYKNWATDQLTEPQLPIYAAFVLEDAEIAAVCFARVRTAQHGFVGIAVEADLLPGLEVFDNEKRRTFEAERFANWQAIITHWQTRITATATALKAGEAAVVFEDEKDLSYCDVLPLLRLPERQLQFERLQPTQEQA